jgi:hypothetical protein
LDLAGSSFKNTSQNLIKLEYLARFVQFLISPCLVGIFPSSKDFEVYGLILPQILDT